MRRNMGSEIMSISDLLRAIFEGAIEAGKVNPIAAFFLGMLNSIRNNCEKLDENEIIQLSLQAKQIQIDDIRKILDEMTFDNIELRQQVESLAHNFVLFLGKYEAIPTTLDELVNGQIAIHQGIQELQNKQSATYARTEQIEGKIDQFIESLSITKTPESLNKATQSGLFHGDIDAACSS